MQERLISWLSTRFSPHALQTTHSCHTAPHTLKIASSSSSVNSLSVHCLLTALSLPCHWSFTASSVFSHSPLISFSLPLSLHKLPLHCQHFPHCPLTASFTAQTTLSLIPSLPTLPSHCPLTIPSLSTRCPFTTLALTLLLSFSCPLSLSSPCPDPPCCLP